MISRNSVIRCVDGKLAWVLVFEVESHADMMTNSCVDILVKVRIQRHVFMGAPGWLELIFCPFVQFESGKNSPLVITFFFHPVSHTCTCHQAECIVIKEPVLMQRCILIGSLCFIMDVGHKVMDVKKLGQGGGGDDFIFPGRAIPRLIRVASIAVVNFSGRLPGKALAASRMLLRTLLAVNPSLKYW